MPATLALGPDDLLTTTRAVRRRLDFEREVDLELVRECARLAQQAPSASNQEHVHFVVVTDPAKRAALADIYRRGYYGYRASRPLDTADPARARLATSADYLAERLHEVPVHVVPCITARAESVPFAAQAGVWGSVGPATWSFMLAARARGLGTCWTTLHLLEEEAAAEVLGIPYGEVMQAGLVPVAHTVGTDFRPAEKRPVEEILHWDAW